MANAFGPALKKKLLDCPPCTTPVYAVALLLPRIWDTFHSKVPID